MNGKKQQKQQDTLSREEFVDGLAKAMHKAVKVYMNEKDDVREIVDDILDPNHEAEVDPDEVGSNKKVNITMKSEDKSLKSHKGLEKLKKYMGRKQ